MENNFITAKQLVDMAHTREYNVVFGVSNTGKYVYRLLQHEMKKNIFMCDTYCLEKFDNVHILRPSEAVMRMPDALYIICARPSESESEMKEQLRGVGISEENIIIYRTQKPKSLLYGMTPDELACEIKERYYLYCSKEFLDLDSPKTYNEIMSWDMAYDRDPRKTRLTDKFEVREWIKDKIGDEYLNKLYGCWESAYDINFDELPDKFVLKTTHACEQNIIVKDKSALNREKTVMQLEEWRKTNHFEKFLEWHYKNIKPRIICEEYIENAENELHDYKVFCFHGKPEYILYCGERFNGGLRLAFYDTNWKKQNFVYGYPMLDGEVDKPKNLDKILALSEILSAEFKYVRVDWYILSEGTIRFGEMTFTSGGGRSKWSPKGIDRLFGELIEKHTGGKDKELILRENTIMKLSIIIPVYNAKQYLRECIESALNQTINDKEILCIDDGSTDGSLEILKDYEKKHMEIKVLSQENQGSGAARNFGLSVARGKYVCFLDSDDWYVDGSALEKMYNACEENGVNVCGSFRLVYNPLNAKTGKMDLHRKDCNEQPDGILMKYSDYQGDFHYHNYIFNRQMLNERDIKFPLFKRYQDPPFFIRAMLAAGDFWVLPVELYCFRATPAARLMEKNKDMRETLRGMCECMNIASQNNLSNLKINLVNRFIREYTRFIDEHPSDEVYELLERLDEYMSEEEKKRTALYPFFKSLLLRENRAYIAHYLQQKGISSIAIYGLGKMGELLYGVLRDTEIKIVCGIDQTKEVFHGLPVISDFFKLSADTVIIITPLYPMGQEIKDTLFRNGFTRTITLTEIVNERGK